MKLISALAATAIAAALPALAGPPLICHPVDIGNAKSLPWRNVPQWDGTDPAYNLAKLGDDTLALLAPLTPINVRRETLRRAALYTSRDAGRAADLTSRLQARAMDSEAAGRPDALAWFDAGYFVETLRQATFIYKYDMLTPAERAAWQIRGEGARLDGYPWVQRAVRLGAKGLEPALAAMEEYRRADQKPAPVRAAR